MADAYKAADAVLALFNAEPKGQPEPASVTHTCVGANMTYDGRCPAPCAACQLAANAPMPNPLAGMPTPWRERIQEAEASISLLDRTLESLNNETEARLSAFERAVEGLKK